MKSFLLSLTLTIGLFLFFANLTDSKAKSFYKPYPEWLFFILLGIVFLSYLLALYWGVTGIGKGQRALNLLGIGFSLLGLCCYGIVYSIQTGSGKESPGQFDHDLSKIKAVQKEALYGLLQLTGTMPEEVKMVPYWEMNENAAGFAICVQKGNIIALQINDKRLPGVKTVSKLTELSWLSLTGCGVTDVRDLHLPLLQRLDLSRNEITALDVFRNCPQLTWLNIKDDPVAGDAAVKSPADKPVYIINL